MVSCQDTDITPTGLGAYASRQTYVAGFAIKKTGRLLREKILDYACEMTAPVRWTTWTFGRAISSAGGTARSS